MQTANNAIVSVIIPTKNRLALLKNALNSVYQQTYPNLEIIVIDVCCDDGTPEFLADQQLSKPIKVYRTQGVVKAGAARNLGIKHATGSFVAFLDDDDEWLPQKLEKQMPLFEDGEIALVYSGVEFVNVDQGFSYNVLPTLTGNVFDELLIDNKIGTTNTVVIRAAVALQYLFDETLPAREEYDLWIRVARHHKIAGVNVPLAKVYSRNTLSRISSDVKNYADAIAIINNKYQADVAQLPPALQAHRIARQHFFLAAQAVKANNVKLARSYYFKSLQTKFSIVTAGSFIASFFGIKTLLLMRKLKG